jgi:hypothetical protein
MIEANKWLIDWLIEYSLIISLQLYQSRVVYETVG